MPKRSQGHQTETSALQSAGLAAGFHLLVESSSTFSNVERYSTSLPLIYSYCEELSRAPQVMRALTDLHHYSFSDFQRALFCSWFSVCFARFLSLDNQRVHDLFCAGLLQDLGKCLPKLDLSEWVAGYTPERSQFEMFHGVNDSHPLIGSSFIEQHFEEHRDVKDLVLHHHARADGMGYPEGVIESFLSLDDQVLIIANEIYSRLNLVENKTTLQEGLVQLKVAGYFYFKNTHTECVRFLKACLAQDYVNNSDTTKVVRSEKDTSHLGKRWQNLGHCILVATELNKALVAFGDDPFARGLRQFIEKLTFFAFDQGVIANEGVQAPTTSLVDRALVLKVIQYHLVDYEKYLDSLIASDQYRSIINLVTKAIASLSLCISTPKLK